MAIKKQFYSFAQFSERENDDAGIEDGISNGNFRKQNLNLLIKYLIALLIVLMIEMLFYSPPMKAILHNSLLTEPRELLEKYSQMTEHKNICKPLTSDLKNQEFSYSKTLYLLHINQ